LKRELDIIDYFKTKETFQLQWNEELACFETFPKPSTVEIGRYYESEEYISHQKEAKSLKDIAYNWVRDYMLKTKINWIEKEIKAGGRILDIGCGVGEFLKKAKQHQFKVTGVEPNTKAKEIAIENKLDVFSEVHEIGETKFNLISLWHVLEHLHDPNEFLGQLKKHLESDGKIFIAVPNFRSYDARYYKEFWAAYDVPRHLYHFSKESIKTLAEQNGYKIKRSYPLKFDSYYVSLLSEKYKTGNKTINWIWRGFLSNKKAKKTGEWSSLVYVLEMNK